MKPQDISLSKQKILSVPTFPSFSLLSCNRNVCYSSDDFWQSNCLQNMPYIVEGRWTVLNMLKWSTQLEKTGCIDLKLYSNEHTPIKDTAITFWNLGHSRIAPHTANCYVLRTPTNDKLLLEHIHCSLCTEYHLPESRPPIWWSKMNLVHLKITLERQVVLHLELQARRNLGRFTDILLDEWPSPRVEVLCTLVWANPPERQVTCS